MDVTRCTDTPLNPYQGPREAGERADLLLPGLGGKGHQAAMLGLDQHGWEYRSPPLDTPLTPPVRVTTIVQQPSAQQGSTVMGGQSSRTLARQSVSLAELPSWQRLSPICPQRRARHARRAAGFWLPPRSPEHQVRPAPIWGSRGRRFKSCQPDRIIAPDLRRRRPTAGLVFVPIVPILDRLRSLRRGCSSVWLGAALFLEDAGDVGGDRGLRHVAFG